MPDGDRYLGRGVSSLGRQSLVQRIQAPGDGFAEGEREGRALVKVP